MPSITGELNSYHFSTTEGTEKSIYKIVFSVFSVFSVFNLLFMGTLNAYAALAFPPDAKLNGMGGTVS